MGLLLGNIIGEDSKHFLLYSIHGLSRYTCKITQELPQNATGCALISNRVCPHDKGSRPLPAPRANKESPPRRRSSRRGGKTWPFKRSSPVAVSRESIPLEHEEKVLTCLPSKKGKMRLAAASCRRRVRPRQKLSGNSISFLKNRPNTLRCIPHWPCSADATEDTLAALWRSIPFSKKKRSVLSNSLPLRSFGALY